MHHDANFSVASAASMGADVDGTPIRLNQAIGYSIHAVWTGTPTGSLKVQVSNDEGSGPLDGSAPVITNWTDLATPAPVALAGAAGTAMFNVDGAMYRWARLKYARTSGTGALSARAQTKGGQ